MKLLLFLMFLMMSGYKMGMCPPREYNKEELKCISSPLLIIASDNDFYLSR